MFLPHHGRLYPNRSHLEALDPKRLIYVNGGIGPVKDVVRLVGLSARSEERCI